MDRNHSRLIVILLACILMVMLVGRDAAVALLGNAFWLALIFGIVVLIVAAIVSFVRFTAREARAYGAEVARNKREGRPWLYTFVFWPGFIGNVFVMGWAALRYFNNECSVFKRCIEGVPLWWLPISVFGLGMLMEGCESLVLKFRRRL